MIPKIGECMFPLLQYMSDREVHSAEECREYISRVFNLSNDEKALLKSKDRVGWAKWNLEQIRMLENRISWQIQNYRRWFKILANNTVYKGKTF